MPKNLVTISSSSGGQVYNKLVYYLDTDSGNSSPGTKVVVQSTNTTADTKKWDIKTFDDNKCIGSIRLHKDATKFVSVDTANKSAVILSTTPFTWLFEHDLQNGGYKIVPFIDSDTSPRMVLQGGSDGDPATIGKEQTGSLEGGSLSDDQKKVLKSQLWNVETD